MQLGMRRGPGIARVGLCASVILFFYGTLFPFQFDFSGAVISNAVRQIGLVPFWNVARERVHSLPDILGNILLTFPFGFFGMLNFGELKANRIVRWAVAGFAIGAVAEVLQLGLAMRTSDITDALNNGLGALAGAAAAYVIGRQALALLTGVLLERDTTYLVLTILVAAGAMLAPFDIGLDVSHFRHVARAILSDPWQGSVPVGDNWIILVEFALAGALAGRMIALGKAPFRLTRSTAIAAILLIPMAIEPAQWLVESHSPGLLSLLLEIAATCAGLVAGLRFAGRSRPVWGFLLLSAALVAAGLSPYHFAVWDSPRSFEWVPLVEYYVNTTPSALADAMTTYLHFALLGGLLGLSLRIPRWLVVFIAAALAGGIEIAQMWIPGRYPGMTDVLIASLGAWTGDAVCGLIETGMNHRERRDSVPFRDEPFS